ncbi:uncharacterized protein PHALS_10724 [Plasmopara halstedii]|uniref:Uncharacterized protein n=1 Tax=Plasmopara halstedii TaxID=4781 RepID=A0A0P1AHQ4_PLAHL|nr:uncharacterized protein PHALS_10724 [Plasmopara halstedii]CEG40530.1 hypothetical protein PHALS_10724 [Plasmopara halstedii]|eukprot:XP_024576899.1 hypothetical protein PHALS_10724 [Plasmopara halstedii]
MGVVGDGVTGSGIGEDEKTLQRELHETSAIGIECMNAFSSFIQLKVANLANTTLI